MSFDTNPNTNQPFGGYAHREDVAAAGASQMGLIAQGGDVDGGSGKITLRQIIGRPGGPAVKGAPPMGSPKDGPGEIKPSPRLASVNRPQPAYSSPKSNNSFGYRSRNFRRLHGGAQLAKQPQPKPTLAQIAANPESPMAKAATRPVTVSLNRQAHQMHLTA